MDVKRALFRKNYHFFLIINIFVQQHASEKHLNPFFAGFKLKT